MARASHRLAVLKHGGRYKKYIYTYIYVSIYIYIYILSPQSGRNGAPPPGVIVPGFKRWHRRSRREEVKAATRQLSRQADVAEVGKRQLKWQSEVT